MLNPSTTIGTGEANMWWAQTSVAEERDHGRRGGDPL